MKALNWAGVPPGPVPGSIMKISSLGIFGTSVTIGDHIQTMRTDFRPSGALLSDFMIFHPVTGPEAL